MMIVTGTQRSGTSLIAKALIESGYDLGASWFDEEAQGGYENEILCAFYREYLGDPKFPFEDMDLPRPSDQSSWAYPHIVNFVNLDLEVTKFCYLLMNPAFVTIWHKFRPEGDTFLVMNRNKQDVVDSKARVLKRFKHDSPLLIQGPATLEGNFDASVYLLNSLGYKIAILDFPACIQYLDGINAQLEYLDPNVQIDPEVWKKVLDTSKIHFGGEP